MKYIFAAFTLLIFNCKNETTKVKTSQKQMPYLTVLSENNTKNPISILLNKTFSNLNTYNNIMLGEKDTLSINISEYEFIEIQNKDNVSDSLIVKQGDTLFINNTNGFITKRLVRNQGNLKTNPISFKDIIEDNFSKKIDSLNAQFFKIDYNSNPLSFSNDYSKIKLYKLKTFRENFKNQKEVEKFIAVYDSLLKRYRAISVKTFKDIRASIYYNFFNDEVLENLKIIYDITKNEQLKAYMISHIKTSYLQNHTDHYGNLRHFIFEILFKDKKDNSRSKITYDILDIYRELPVYINNDDLLRKARVVCLETMAEQGSPIKEITFLLDKFNKTYSDTLFNNYFQKKYLLDLKKRYNSSKELSLIDANGKIISFSNLKKKLKGNVIYIDLWASWCAPCRSAMPASRELISEFYGKNNIVFLYFSIDKNQNAWQKASKIEGIETYEYNYLILNHEHSDLIKNLNIKEIPRYLIFGTQGNLLEANAPGPTSKDIKNSLLKYSRKQFKTLSTLQTSKHYLK